MKLWLPAVLCCAALLSGCSSEYIITTTDGQMLTSDGKPELDKDTGMLEFEDSEGRVQQIPQNNVKQMLER
ncbi:MAG: YgdI/YgdR family lipoprotein [Pseudomonas sp.]